MTPREELLIRLRHVGAGPFEDAVVSALDKYIDEKLDPLIRRLEELSRDVWKRGT